MSMKTDMESIVEKTEDERLWLLKNQLPSRYDPNIRGRHSVVCRHWMRNMCMRGDFCDFLHQYDREKMPPCFTYQKYGVCLDRVLNSCPFKHKSDDTQLCADYFLGLCPFGPMCKRNHEPKVRNEAPDFLPDEFLQTIIQSKHLMPIMDLETQPIVKEIEDTCKENYIPAECIDT